MPLNGNLGYNGVENYINKLSSIDNPLFIKAPLDYFWQENQKIEDYIVDNYKCLDETILGMRIFVSKD